MPPKFGCDNVQIAAENGCVSARRLDRIAKTNGLVFSHTYAKNADGVDVDDDAVAKLFRNRLVKSFAIGWLKTSQLVGYNLRNRLFSQEGPCYECEIEFKSVSSSLC